MKNNLLALILTLITFEASGQLYKFPQPGMMQGEYIYSGYCSPCTSSYSSNTITYLKDTMLVGVNYSKINAGNYGIIYTRYSNGQVYMANPLGMWFLDFLLYDFNLKLYDLFTLYKSQTAVLYGTYQVDSVSTITCLNGQKRKYMRLVPYSGTNVKDTLYWIDGIGDIKNGLLYQQTGWIDSWGSEHFVCHHDSSGLVFGGSDSLYNCNSLKIQSSQIGFKVDNGNCSIPADICITASGLSGCTNYIYQWSNGATTAKICSLSPGIYTVTVLDCSGNSASRSVALSACNLTVVNKFEKEINYRIYPNPSTTSITLELNQTKAFKIQLIDMLGQIVYSSIHPSSSSFTIDVGILPKGVYLVQLSDLECNTSGIKKIVVQ